MSDYDQCLNGPQLDLILILVNFTFEVGQIMTRYHFQEAKWVILSNFRTDSQLYLISLMVNLSHESGQIMTRYDFLEAKWVTLTNVRTDVWIGANNAHIWLPMGWTSDLEQCSKRLQLDMNKLLVNFAHGLGQVIARYDLLEARWLILSNVRTDFNLTWFHFWWLTSCLPWNYYNGKHAGYREIISKHKN